jgi:serine/threonine-protein kinase
VARVLDVGTLDAGEPYMVMEYLAGEDLAYHAHARTPVTLGDAIDYITQACDAIAEAHQLGIVHRDVKPANLFLTRRADGTPMVKVLDFGISKVAGEGERDVALTQTTTILGSALYMSPEQMQSAKHVDRRTDIYALGVCLFELMSREQPYFAESFPELCAKVFTSPPKSLRSLRPEVPDGLEKVIERALARDPGKRYQSVCELLQALSPYARLDTRARMETILRRHEPQRRLLPPAPMAATVSLSAPRPAPPPRVEEPPRRRSPLPFLVATCALAVAGGLGWRAWRERASREPPPAPISAEPTAAASADPVAAPLPDLPAAPSASAASQPAPPEAVATASPKTSAASAGATAPAPAKAAAAPARRGEGAQRPAAVDRAPPTSGAPPAATNTDLVLETCKARMPDGTEKIVPCN